MYRYGYFSGPEGAKIGFGFAETTIGRSTDMSENRILAVIDPTRDEQWALQKAVSIGGRQQGTTVFAYLCVHSNAKCDDPERLREVELRRTRPWLEKIVSEFAEAGVAIEPLLGWRADWRRAVSDAAQAVGAQLVIKRASGRPSSLSNSDRQLIRSLKDSALLLIKHDPVSALHKVVVAIDLNARDEAHVALNNAIMALGKRVRGDDTDIELHAISAYPTSDRFVHPPDVAKILEIKRSHAHVSRGVAADVIPRMANSIDADLVILGNVGRQGLSGLTVGNTAEKILTDIKADVLVVVREVAESIKAA
jgi:universal stress protein E